MIIASGIAFGGAIVAVLVCALLRGCVWVLPGCIGFVITASGIDPGGAMVAVRGFGLMLCEGVGTLVVW